MPCKPRISPSPPLNFSTSVYNISRAKPSITITYKNFTISIKGSLQQRKHVFLITHSISTGPYNSIMNTTFVHNNSLNINNFSHKLAREGAAIPNRLLNEVNVNNSFQKSAMEETSIPKSSLNVNSSFCKSARGKPLFPVTNSTSTITFTTI